MIINVGELFVFMSIIVDSKKNWFLIYFLSFLSTAAFYFTGSHFLLQQWSSLFLLTFYLLSLLSYVSFLFLLYLPLFFSCFTFLLAVYWFLGYGLIIWPAFSLSSGFLASSYLFLLHTHLYLSFSLAFLFNDMRL